MGMGDHYEMALFENLQTNENNKPSLPLPSLRTIMAFRFIHAFFHPTRMEYPVNKLLVLGKDLTSPERTAHAKACSSHCSVLNMLGKLSRGISLARS